ncbi:hypothetical protein LMG29542_01463 [Paraburkholderia humisilvae]|uniref:Uncharacterized protein n=2 Tax=Paraburkholderia humisilvae TaxID=627669 RepID=A0A6J5DAM6_9BURK|nr:hypothetical protein LMG29542_01463 [Paraburkholderia humisilvae]
MLSRLYMTSNPGTTPYLSELTFATMASNPVDFLTRGDREFLANVYSYAQSQGIDLRYVDDVASDMGMYRKFGKVEANSNSQGMSFNSKGQALTYSFTAADSTSASNILNGGAFGSTRFDHGFLRFELNPGYSFNHVANFSFLQGMAEHFSNVGASDTDTFAQRFSTYTAHGQNNFLVTAASEVTLDIPQSDSGSSQSDALKTGKRTDKAVSQLHLNPGTSTQSLWVTLLDSLLVWRRKREL